MSAERDAPESALETVRRGLGASLYATWIGYLEVGGDGTLRDVGRWLGGTEAIPTRDHDFLAQSLNDMAVELGGDHPAPYFND